MSILKYDEPKIRNQIYIIGNGFDLAHGLETSYNHFILNSFKEQLITCCNNKKLNQKSNKYLYEDELFSYSISKFYTAVFLKKINDPKIDNIAHEELSNLFQIKPKSNFAKNLYKSSIDRWVDIEDLFYKELKTILKHEYSGSDVATKTKIVKSLNSQLEYLKNKLENYLYDHQKKSSLTHKIHPDFFTSHLIERHNGDLIDPHLYFLNFNYTKTINKYLTSVFNNISIKINNIHGELLNKNNPIIFGFGDEKDKNYQELEDLNVDEVFANIKSFDYFLSKNYKDLIALIDSYDYDVTILGHSCGLSDRTMLSTIFEHKNCKSIRICYYQSILDTEDKGDFINKTYSISRLFDDKEDFRKKVSTFNKNDRIPQFDDAEKRRFLSQSQNANKK